MSLDNLMRLVEGAAALGVGVGLVTLPWWLSRPKPQSMTADEMRAMISNARVIIPPKPPSGGSVIPPRPDVQKLLIEHAWAPTERAAPRYYVRQFADSGWYVMDRLAKHGAIRHYARKWTAERGAARLNAKVGK